MSETNKPADPALRNIHSILQWLAQGKYEPKKRYFDILREHLTTLRDTPLPTAQSLKILDLLYEHNERMLEGLLPTLHKVSLPVPRRTRWQVQSAQTVLEALSQDYTDCLAEIFDPQGSKPSRSPGVTLWRSIHCLSVHLLVSYLVAAPARVGVWHNLHRCYQNAVKYGFQHESPSPELPTLQQIYLRTLVIACAQPASFNSAELVFISDYVSQFHDRILLTDNPGQDDPSYFWVEMESDSPPFAVVRRQPDSGQKPPFFSCSRLADLAKHHLNELDIGIAPGALDLPEFASTPAGKGVLRRIAMFWGTPGKRRFHRRRQSFRAALCVGVDSLWWLLHNFGEMPENASHWMITNESADGYAIMHVSGVAERLQVGDVVALRAEEAPENQKWQVCVVRWACSENAEHIELGLQVVSPFAIPAQIVVPELANSPRKGRVSALLLPELPPLRAHRSLILPAGVINSRRGSFVLMVEGENLQINEVKATHLDEQTSRIEIFTIESTGDA